MSVVADRKTRMSLGADTRLALLESDQDELDRRVDRLERKWDWLIGLALVSAGGTMTSVLLLLVQLKAGSGHP